MIKRFLIENMFWMTISICILQIILSQLTLKDSWDLTRTIGWGWDVSNFVWWIGISLYNLLLFIFLVGYGILKLNSCRTNFKLSTFHFVLLIFGIVPYFDVQLNVIYLLLITVVFILNVKYSVRQTDII